MTRREAHIEFSRSDEKHICDLLDEAGIHKELSLKWISAKLGLTPSNGSYSFGDGGLYVSAEERVYATVEQSVEPYTNDILNTHHLAK